MFYLLLILFLLAGGVLTAVTMQNLMIVVHLTLFTWQTPDLPLGLFLLIFFIAGALVLYLVSVISAWRDRRELQRLRKHIKQLEQQVEQKQTSFISPPVQSPQASTLQMPGMYRLTRN